MLSNDVIEKVLGIDTHVTISPREMARTLNITFYPYNPEKISHEVKAFAEKLADSFRALGVNVVPYGEAIEVVSFKRIFRRFYRILFNNIGCFFERLLFLRPRSYYIPFSAYRNTFRRKKIKVGISVIALGENQTWNLPMDHTTSFTKSSVISIVDFPKEITKDSSFHTHFDTAMGLFAYHMANIVIGVSKDKWILYNFNASYPIYPLDEHFDEHILAGLIPKIAAPIRPHLLSEFVLKESHFDPFAPDYANLTKDLVGGSWEFSKTNLYPAGKKIDSLPFRNNFYRWIGKIHLDERSGMSFGFMARQMPVVISKLYTKSEFKSQFGISPTGEYFLHEGEVYFSILVKDIHYYMKVPEISVLSQRSGSDKTRFDPTKDLVKITLRGGRMFLETPKGLVLTKEYKPSFDTKVILAHALGNAIVASVLNFVDEKNAFSLWAKEMGFAIAHWHGYIHPAHIPKGFYTHGTLNPHVACSSPQSAIFALQGKLGVFAETLREGKEFRGDIHIEPHHGVNITFPSLIELATFLVRNPDASLLGNRYLELYNKNL